MKKNSSNNNKNKNNNNNRQHELKANALYTAVQQQKQLLQKPSFILWFYGGKSIIHEEIADSLVKTAQAYAIAKNHVKAGRLYVEAASFYETSGFGAFQATSCYEKAARSFLKGEEEGNRREKDEDEENDDAQEQEQDERCKDEALKAFMCAMEKCKDEGRFDLVAKYEGEMGEIEEKEGGEESLRRAIQHYESAVEFYSDSSASSHSIASTLKKIFSLCVSLGDFEKALSTIDKLILTTTTSTSSTLSSIHTSWKLKDLYLKLGLCHLCVGDIVAAKKSTQNVEKTCPSLRECREYVFFNEMVSKAEEMDGEGMESLIQERENSAMLMSDDVIGRLVSKVMEAYSEPEDLEVLN